MYSLNTFSVTFLCKKYPFSIGDVWKVPTYSTCLHALHWPERTHRNGGERKDEQDSGRSDGEIDNGGMPCG